MSNVRGDVKWISRPVLLLQCAQFASILWMTLGGYYGLCGADLLIEAGIKLSKEGKASLLFQEACLVLYGHAPLR